jgi:4-amino-4-deoxy-L-arabinose transferase-like glycosyltransferase
MTANQALGALAILLAGGCFILAWRAVRAGHPRRALGLILAGGAVLRIYAGLDPYLHPWDERYHAVVARNLIGHPLTPTLYDDPALPYDPRSWLDNHVWLHKPPLALWLMAASMAVLGVNEAALRLPSLALSTAGIGLTYGLGTRLFDWRVGLLAAFFHAIHGLLIDLASGGAASDHVDTTLFFCVELGVYLALRHAESSRARYLLGVGLATGLAVLAKWLVGLVVLPVWLAARWGRTGPFRLLGEGVVIVLVGTALAAPWQLSIAARFPIEAGRQARDKLEYLTLVKDGRGGGALYHLRDVPRLFGELAPVALAWFLWRVLRRREPGPARALVVWLAVPYAVFSLAATKMPGYVLVAAPALFVIQARACEALRRASRRPGWRVPALVGLALLVALPARQALDRLKPFNVGDVGAVRAARELRDLATRLPDGRVALFLVGDFADGISRHVDAMFYTGRPTYSQLPTREDVGRLAREGRTVVIYQRGEAALAPDLEASAGVRVLRPRGP